MSVGLGGEEAGGGDCFPLILGLKLSNWICTWKYLQGRGES